MGGVEEGEKNIFYYISKNDVNGVKSLLPSTRGDIFDEHGMTPLQHAAYKGNVAISQMLLDQVNNRLDGCVKNIYQFKRLIYIKHKGENICTLQYI